MADLELRFDKDMLVISSPLDYELHKLGVAYEQDLELTLLVEPELIEEALRMESLVGVQCLATPTGNFTPARLAALRMTAQAESLVQEAFSLIRPFKPQHPLVELYPCGLPLDPLSKNSLKENRDQYSRAAKLFENYPFDGFLLTQFTKLTDLKCALMGIRKVSDKPILASMVVDAEGNAVGDGATLEQICTAMEDLEASVAGFRTGVGPNDAWKLAKRAHQYTTLPLLMELEVVRDPDALRGLSSASEAYPYGTAEAMLPAAMTLREGAVQFLRAVGEADATYAGALVAATTGVDVELSSDIRPKGVAESQDQDTDFDAIRDRIGAALKGTGMLSGTFWDEPVPASQKPEDDGAAADAAQTLRANLDRLDEDL